MVLSGVELNIRRRPDRLDVNEAEGFLDCDREEPEVLLRQLTSVSGLLGRFNSLGVKSREPLDHRLEQRLNLVALQLLDPVLHLPNDLLVVLGTRMEPLNLRLQPLERGRHGVLTHVVRVRRPNLLGLGAAGWFPAREVRCFA